MRYVLFLLLVFATVSPGRAGFDARLVPADARWLLYADISAMRASPVGQELLTALEPLLPDSEALHKPEAQSLRALATAIFIHGVSFSPQGEAGDGVLLIEGPKFRSLMELIVDYSSGQPDSVFYKRTDFPFAAYGVRATRGRGESTSPTDSTDLVIAFPTDPVVLASKSRDRLAQSVRLLDRRGPSLAVEDKAPLRRFLPAAQGTYFFGATATAPSLDAGRPASTAGNLLAFVGAGCLGLSEVGSSTQARVDLLPATDHDPKTLLPTLQGLAALATSSNAAPPMVRALLLAATITERDGLITLRASCPNDTLVAPPERVAAASAVSSP